MRNFGVWTAATIGMALAGCDAPGGSPGGNASAPVAAASPSAPTPPAAPAAPPPAPTFAAKTTASTGDYDFTYSLPPEVAQIAPLATWFADDRAKAQASVAKDAAEFRKDATENGFPFRKYESTTDWKGVTSTPQFLSLSAETYDYTGGAHGSPGFRSLVWDRERQARIDPTDLFASEAAIQSAIGAAFCDALDVQRGKRRGTPVVRGTDGFNDCPKVSEATLILGSTNGRAIDRIGLLVGPYVAGPYAEGSYDLTLPVTPAVLRTVKPEYRGAFATRG